MLSKLGLARENLKQRSSARPNAQPNERVKRYG